MNKKGIILGIILAVALGGGFYYRFTHLASGKSEKNAEKQEGAAKKNNEPKTVTMTLEKQKQNGVIVAVVRKERLAGVINATGKVEVNGDRIAHVSPRIPGKITSVKASLGDSIASGQILVLLDSVELGEAMNRYYQSKTKLSLVKNNLERVKALVEKKIAARKDILQAETEYQITLTALHTDEERLLLYGLDHKKQLLPVRSPIGGIVTEKHAIVGELADPSKSIYTVADLSSVWVMVDINERDLTKVHKGQKAIVTVGAFPDLKFRGRINHIADMVDEATRTVKARIEVQNTKRKLKPEMFANVELALPLDTQPVLVIPVDSLQDLHGNTKLHSISN